MAAGWEATSAAPALEQNAPATRAEFEAALAAYGSANPRRGFTITVHILFEDARAMLSLIRAAYLAAFAGWVGRTSCSPPRVRYKCMTRRGTRPAAQIRERTWANPKGQRTSARRHPLAAHPRLSSWRPGSLTFIMERPSSGDCIEAREA
jgi:hypothetical protein